MEDQPREYICAAPEVPLSDEVLAAGLQDIISMLGWYLAAAHESRQTVIDKIIIAAEHAVDQLT